MLMVDTGQVVVRKRYEKGTEKVRKNIVLSYRTVLLEKYRTVISYRTFTVLGFVPYRNFVLYRTVLHALVVGEFLVERLPSLFGVACEVYLARGVECRSCHFVVTPRIASDKGYCWVSRILSPRPPPSPRRHFSGHFRALGALTRATVLLDRFPMDSRCFYSCHHV